MIAENGVEYFAVADLRKAIESAPDHVGIHVVNEKTKKWFRITRVIESEAGSAPMIFLEKE